MKIAISAKGTDLDAEIDERFGRAAYILIVDSDTMTVDVLDNTENINAAQGAGIQAASMVSGQGAGALLTGSCGPKAMTAFAGAGVAVYTGQFGSVRQAVERFKKGELQQTTQANVGEKFGVNNGAGPSGSMFTTGGGRGMGGRGMGGGRRCMGGSGRGMGMGQGVGQGMGMAGSAVPGSRPAGGTENIADLKKQAAELQRQLDAIQNKIKEM
jgi:predicted Fe-Mo cluster-binding NifX family protein